MFCPQCGTEATANARFCVSCGSPLTQPDRVVPSVSAPSTVRHSKRPKWVWIIVAFYVFSLGWTLLSFAFMFSGAISLNAAQDEYFASLNILDYLSSTGIGLVTIWAVFLLFRLRKNAVRALGVALALNVGLTFIHMLTKSWAAALGGSGFVGVLLGWMILGLVFLYARRLDRGGVLV